MTGSCALVVVDVVVVVVVVIVVFVGRSALAEGVLLRNIASFRFTGLQRTLHAVYCYTIIIPVSVDYWI